MAESELQGLSYDENSNAAALYAPLSNATAMKARISPAMELRCPASEGVANQRWLGKGNAPTRDGRAMVAPTRSGTAAPSKGLAECVAALNCDDMRRQSAAFNRNGGKEPIGKGKASTGFERQRPTKSAIRSGKPLRFLAMASQRLQGWAKA